jgi:hypothetical protein
MKKSVYTQPSKLPFWPNLPAAWFCTAEVKHVMSAIDKYYLALGALGEVQVELIKNIMDEVAGDNSYWRM